MMMMTTTTLKLWWTPYVDGVASSLKLRMCCLVDLPMAAVSQLSLLLHHDLGWLASHHVCEQGLLCCTPLSPHNTTREGLPTPCCCCASPSEVCRRLSAVCTRVRCGEGCLSACTRVADHVKVSKWRHLNGVHQAPTWRSGVNQNCTNLPLIMNATSKRKRQVLCVWLLAVIHSLASTKRSRTNRSSATRCCSGCLRGFESRCRGWSRRHAWCMPSSWCLCHTSALVLIRRWLQQHRG